MFHRRAARERHPVRAVRAAVRPRRRGLPFRPRFCRSAMSSTMAPSSSSASGNSRFATSARSRHIFTFSMDWYFSNASAIFCAGELLRRQIHLQMQLAQFRRRGRADRRDARAAEVAQVLKAFEENVEKRRHAVRAREHQPVVGIQFQQASMMPCRSSGAAILIVGTSSTSAPSSASLSGDGVPPSLKFGTPTRRPFQGARHDDALAEQRTLFKPV